MSTLSKIEKQYPRKKERLSVLMYHGTIKSEADIPPQRETGAKLYDLADEMFKKQMNYLKTWSCFVTTVDRLDPNRFNIVLTFDDGEENNFFVAYPILAQNGFPAYFFVTANRVGEDGYMTWQQLKAMQKEEMIIGSHGLNHIILTDLSDAELNRELLDSKVMIEDNLNSKVKDFAVPRGFFNEKVVEAARRAGYQNIFVSGIKNIPPDCIGRIAVKSDWTIRRFKQALKNQTPLNERLFYSAKKITKNLFGDKGYDLLRSGLLKGRK